jgi:hypothetical protein
MKSDIWQIYYQTSKRLNFDLYWTCLIMILHEDPHAPL